MFNAGRLNSQLRMPRRLLMIWRSWVRAPAPGRSTQPKLLDQVKWVPPNRWGISEGKCRHSSATPALELTTQAAQMSLPMAKQRPLSGSGYGRWAPALRYPVIPGSVIFFFFYMWDYPHNPSNYRLVMILLCSKYTNTNKHTLPNVLFLCFYGQWFNLARRAQARKLTDWQTDRWMDALSSCCTNATHKCPGQLSII